MFFFVCAENHPGKTFLPAKLVLPPKLITLSHKLDSTFLGVTMDNFIFCLRPHNIAEFPINAEFNTEFNQKDYVTLEFGYSV